MNTTYIVDIYVEGCETEQRGFDTLEQARAYCIDNGAIEVIDAEPAELDGYIPIETRASSYTGSDYSTILACQTITIQFSLTDSRERVSLGGDVTFWRNQSGEPDVRYYHPLTGSHCEGISQALAGFSEQEDSLNAAWAELVAEHRNDEEFVERLAEELPADFDALI